MEIGQQTSLSGRSPGGISIEININLRKGGDVDRSLHPPPLNLHLQTFAENRKSKDPDSLTRKEKKIYIFFFVII